MYAQLAMAPHADATCTDDHPTRSIRPILAVSILAVAPASQNILIADEMVTFRGSKVRWIGRSGPPQLPLAA